MLHARWPAGRAARTRQPRPAGGVPAAPGRLNWRTQFALIHSNGRRRADAAVGRGRAGLGPGSGRRLGRGTGCAEVERQRRLRSVADYAAHKTEQRITDLQAKCDALLMRMGRKQTRGRSGRSGPQGCNHAGAAGRAARRRHPARIPRRVLNRSTARCSILPGRGTIPHAVHRRYPAPVTATRHSIPQNGCSGRWCLEDGHGVAVLPGCAVGVGPSRRSIARHQPRHGCVANGSAFAVFSLVVLHAARPASSALTEAPC